MEVTKTLLTIRMGQPERNSSLKEIPLGRSSLAGCRSSRLMLLKLNLAHRGPFEPFHLLKKASEQSKPPHPEHPGGQFQEGFLPDHQRRIDLDGAAPHSDRSKEHDPAFHRLPNKLPCRIRIGIHCAGVSKLQRSDQTGGLSKVTSNESKSGSVAAALHKHSPPANSFLG